MQYGGTTVWILLCVWRLYLQCFGI